MEYTKETILDILSSMGDEKRKKYNKKQGVNDNQFGVTMGNLRPLAKKIKKDHSLAFELWNTGNFDAMILSTMIFDPKLFSESDFETLIEGAYMHILVDELTFQALFKSFLAKEFIDKWANKDDERYGRAGWNLAINLVINKELKDEEIEALLSEIEAKMTQALPLKQWAMNRCMCEIGIHYDKYTDRCLLLGERLGVYKDLKVAKGCTSAYAPNWINVVREKLKK